MKRLKRKLVVGLMLGLAVFAGLALYADVTGVARLLQLFEWRWLPAIAGLTAVNYALRFAKWHIYLRRIGVTTLPVWDSLRIFIGGFSLTLTPGKGGELIRLLWLKNRAGVQPAKTAPVAVAERLTDGIAMTLLCLLGGAAYPQYWPATILIGLALALVVLAVQIKPLALWGLKLGERLPLVSGMAHSLHVLYRSAYQLFRPRNLLLGVGLGGVAWGAQGVALYLTLVGLGAPGELKLAFLSIFILAFASVAGGASGLPGGLGVTEGGITGMLQLLAGASQNVAVTATLLIRFCILWSGVVAGWLIVAVWGKGLFGPQPGAFEHLALELERKP